MTMTATTEAATMRPTWRFGGFGGSGITAVGDTGGTYGGAPGEATGPPAGETGGTETGGTEIGGTGTGSESARGRGGTGLFAGPPLGGLPSTAVRGSGPWPRT